MGEQKLCKQCITFHEHRFWDYFNNFPLCQEIINQELSLCEGRKKELIAEMEDLSNQYSLAQSMLTRQDELLKRFLSGFYLFVEFEC